MMLQQAHDHHEVGFVRKYLFSTDHKMIGKQFLFTALTFYLVGGALALGVRYQLGWPNTPVPVLGSIFGWQDGVMPGEGYNMLFTMHASVMIFLVIIPMLVGAFGNFVTPLQIGARDMAFPTLNMLSYWMMWPAAAFLVASFFVKGGAAQSGWTNYAPLSESPWSPGPGGTLWCAGVFCAGASSIMGAVNYITTIVKMRAPGMTFFRMPLTTWSVFITSMLVLFATPVVGSALLMMILDRAFGANFFLAEGLTVSRQLLDRAGGGQTLMWQHIFWFYSHPAVYIMILPGMGIVSDVLATNARKPIFGYRPMVYSISAIAGLGFIVWGHHMFTSGMNPYLGMTFMISTMMIALPSAVKVFNWLGTLWQGNIKFSVPMLHALAFVSMFVIGGLSGIFMAATPVDMHIHDTYFIVGHIHYVLFGGSTFAIFAGILHWFPKMFGTMFNNTLGKVHFWITFIAFNCTFFPMHIIGSQGFLRRVKDPYLYEYLKEYLGMNRFMSISAMVLGAAQILFFINLFWSMFKGPKPKSDNPWHCNSLEWSTPTPPPHGNFVKIPTVYRGPYEYASPEVAEDYLPQDRDLAATRS
jgi:cytochrome c oxidase subunit I